MSTKIVETLVQPRPVKEGETFIVKGGKAYVGNDEVTIPQLSYVDVGGADGHWEANLQDYLYARGQAGSRGGVRPRNQVMLSAGILVDVEEQHAKVRVVQLYAPPVPKDCVVRCIEHFQHVRAQEVNDNTVITVSGRALGDFGESLSHAFERPVKVKEGMTVGQLVSCIESTQQA